MKRILFFFLTFLSASTAFAACTAHLSVTGVIGPAAYDYIERGLKHSHEWGCTSILMTVNTPGGSLQSTRLIVEKILDSKEPFLCLVSPSGGHAGSAGAIILQACHVTGALAGTNIGAASPVSGDGAKIEDDLRKKIFNDTISWVESLASLRGRSRSFARDTVEKATALSAEEAQKVGGIDIVPRDIEEFLKFAQDKNVKINNGQTTLVQTGTLREFEPDLRYKVLEFLTDPQFAYLIFMASLALLYFEITHPGMIAPGVFGALGLVVALISFHKLDVSWGGVALLILGVMFMVAELFVPSFGALGVGGLIAFATGSLLLFDPATNGFGLPLSTILPTVLGLGGFMLFLGYMALRTTRLKTVVGVERFVGSIGRVVTLKDSGLEGQVEIQGETWAFHSHVPVQPSGSVRVTAVEDLKLTVEPVSS